MSNNPSDTRIKKLSPLLINQLAAGEVVTRPAAVVKELLENAIDAGATDIEVRVTQGGMGMIEVVDNGVGIHPDDMVMAITRHATSKVADVANLHGIMTLGFRGEALAATAAVSRLTLVSSHDNTGIGRQLQVAGVLDDMPKLLPVVRTRGTTITVRDLYFNVPARRGNLKSIATEFSHTETIVREVALARADITLTLFHDNKKRLSLSANAISVSSIDSGTNYNNRLSLARLEQATATALTDNAIEVKVDLASLIQQSIARNDSNATSNHASISGWLWPIHDQKDTAPKLLYVNGRLVKEALISNQLRQLAQNAQLAGVGYALYFDLPTEWLNINVHPSKQRIKISPLNNIMAHLSHALRPKLQTVDVPNTNKLQEETASTNYLSTNHSTDKTVSEALLGDSFSQSRQVESPKQSYQLSENKSSPKTTEFYNDKSLIHKDNHSDVTLPNNAAILNEALSDITGLPYCLDVITSLSGIASETTFIQNNSDQALPWILFYSQGQFFIIGANDWRVSIGSLFVSSVLDNNGFKKDNVLNSAYDINKQLASLSAQMTKQDLAVFIADIEALLVRHSIKAIDRNQLVALMLSSTYEPPFN